MTVTVYVAPGCPGCTATQRKLDNLGVTYATEPIDSIAEQARAAGIATAPVVQVGDEMWGGYRPDRLTALAAALVA